MIRLTISLPQAMHKHISVLAIENNSSLSKVINQLLIIGVQNWDNKSETNPLERHCQQLIIQMNAILKNLAVELLKFNQEDFEHLRQATIAKLNNLT